MKDQDTIRLTAAQALVRYLAAQAILYAKMLSATVINIVQACQCSKLCS